MRIRRMFIVVFICALLLMFPLPAAGEQMSTPPDSRSSPVEEWSQTFGGSSNDYGYSVAVTSDGGYIVTGRTQSYGSGGFDAWLVKAGDSDTTVTPGDGNGDGSVNALDITKVERVIVGLDADTPGADANSDGNINAMDITKIELIIAGLD
jgi:hypothetical protein